MLIEDVLVSLLCCFLWCYGSNQGTEHSGQQVNAVSSVGWQDSVEDWGKKSLHCYCIKLQLSLTSNDCLVSFRMALAVVVVHHYNSRRVGCSVWCRVRSRHLWEAVQNGLISDRWWRENLRMSECTFRLLCNLCLHTLRKGIRSFLFVITFCTVYNIHRLLASECLCLLKKGLLWQHGSWQPVWNTEHCLLLRSWTLYSVHNCCGNM